DQFFGQSLLPCQGKPGAHSQAALILLRHLESGELGQLHVDRAARGADQGKIKFDEAFENFRRVSENLDESGAAEFHVILAHDRLQLRVDFFKWNRTKPCHRILRLDKIACVPTYLSRTCARQKRAPVTLEGQKRSAEATTRRGGAGSPLRTACRRRADEARSRRDACAAWLPSRE